MKDEKEGRVKSRSVQAVVIIINIPSMTDAKAVSALVCTIAGLSSTACFAVVASYACMNDRPRLSDPSSMIIFLTLSDLALSIVSIISMKGIDRTVLEGSEYHMCASKVMLLIYFSFSSFLWTAAMSHSSYLTVKNLFSSFTVQTSRRSSMRRDSLTVGTSIISQGSSYTTNYSIWYHVGCWGAPILFCLLFANEDMGNVGGVSGSVCWFIVDSEWSKVAAVFTLAPLGLILTYNLYVLFYFITTLRNFPASDELISTLKRSLLIRVLSKLLIFVSFIFCTYLSFVHRPSQFYFADDEKNVDEFSWLLTLFIFLSPSIQGFVDAFVFFDGRLRFCRFGFLGGAGMERVNTSENDSIDRSNSSRVSDFIGRRRGSSVSSSSAMRVGMNEDDDDIEMSISGNAHNSVVTKNPMFSRNFKMYKGLQTKSDTGSVHNIDLDTSLGGESNISIVDDNDNDDNISEYRDAEDMGGLMQDNNDEEDDDDDDNDADDVTARSNTPRNDLLVRDRMESIDLH